MIRTGRASRRLIVFVGAVYFAEAAFYAVISPLIPRLVHDVGLTTTDVGFMVAAYPAGVLLAAIPAMALVDSRGVRATTIAGLVILIAATLGFGWGTTAPLLDAARLVQGIGGALACAGALAWLTSTTPEDRRASVIGGAVGAALVGIVLGPGLGAVAASMGRGPVFSGLAVVLLLLCLAGPAAAPSDRPSGSLAALSRLLRSRSAVVGSTILLVVGVVGGTVGSLVPLLVARRQGGAEAIAAILAASFLLAALLNVMLGRLSDLVGRLAPALGALVLAAVLLPVLPFLDTLLPLAVATILASAAVSGIWAPTAVMVTDGADPGPMGHAVAVATMNAAWAAGGAGGAVVVASLADTVGFIPPFALVGGLCAAAAAALVLSRRAPERDP